jgi:2-oxoglutarate ferredoxin oxidoreductase subunit alpha
MALKSEAINLAVMTELPVVILDVQRAGPSTGMPTKTEQADLLLAVFGRPSESPVPVLAPSSVPDCFDTALEAVRIAVRYMTPVIVLADLYLVFGSEPWRIPDPDTIAPIEIPPRRLATPSTGNGEHKPYGRDPKTLARPWVPAGTPGFEHRIGGLEKSQLYGDVSYDPDNHDAMVKLRAEKIERIAQDYPPQDVYGAPEGRLLVVGWGSTFGPIRTAVEQLLESGLSVGHLHLRHLHPLPADLGAILSRYRRILVPENNLGQLRLLLRARYLADVLGYNRVTGQPFTGRELREEFLRHVNGR